MSIHEGQPVLRAGATLADAKAALILLHGRGASAEDILSLGTEVASGLPGLALIAPQAANHAWYPQRFIAPLAQNEPHLTSALSVVSGLIADATARGVLPDRIAILGFSQGACLSLEFSARHARHYGAVIGLSGALIGPPGTVREVSGDLSGTPIYLGCGDNDSHIPASSVSESAEILRELGADVRETIFPGMGHRVNAEELEAVQTLLRGLVERD